MNKAYSSSYLQRFSGIARLYGYPGLACFAKANICVIGMGGVGTWAAEALIRTGIGAITLIDMDEICITNTNRQIHALHQHLGQSKIEVMAERIQAINPECKVTCIDEFITSNNVDDLLNHNFSYVIDAIDSVGSKASLLFYCRRHNIPVVTTGAAGGKIDPTKIAVSDLANTIQDPLSAKLRERLLHDFKVRKNSKGKFDIDCVFSSEPLIVPEEDSIIFTSSRIVNEKKRIDCSTGFGASTMVTATFGFIATSHVIKKMLWNMEHQR